ncbi:MAG: class I SAM-dependent methyltransferase [Pseudomonadota bacterium]|nr:class I SAM-dependent methyltransferase [Pseudomonadota bacterium]
MSPSASPPSAFILAEIDRWMAQQPGRDVISLVDLACGTGRHVTALFDRGYPVTMQITAADINQNHLEMLKMSLPAGAPVTPVCVDLEQDGAVLADQLGQSRFDLVLVTNYLHRPLLAQIFGLVSPGGLILYETFGQGNEVYGKPSNPDFLLAEDELTDRLPADFAVQHRFFGQRQELYPERPPAIICQLAAQRNR